MSLYNTFAGEPTYIAGFASSYARILKAMRYRPVTAKEAATVAHLTQPHAHVIFGRLRRKGLIVPSVLGGPGVPRPHLLTPKGRAVVTAWELLRSLGPSKNGGRRADSARKELA